MILTASNSGSHVSAGETGNPELGGDHEMVPVYAAMLLLMLSGDVETNPGPVTEELGEIRLDIKYTDGRITCKGKFYF